MQTYTNPVYDGYFADPFVLALDGIYYAYGTAPFHGRTVPALVSRDLVRWRELGDVLESLGDPAQRYWAPEVAFADGTFHMYYSTGGEEGEGHQLRVACATDAAGPFVDCGVVLDPADPFTIDAHPFRDDDGRWYLFYCRDFLDGDRVGSGIVVDGLVDMRTLAHERKTVLRPFADWNLFMKERSWSGRVGDWYTVEGPFVRKRDGRYYCFFSGGDWHGENYGVSYAVAEHPLGPYDVPARDHPTILRGVSGEVHGPGHVSLAASPAGGTDYLVYHAWDGEGRTRQMRIDRLEWTEEGPRCDGPTTDPQPVPV